MCYWEKKADEISLSFHGDAREIETNTPSPDSISLLSPSLSLQEGLKMRFKENVRLFTRSLHFPLFFLE